jgi:imidazolonepropionase-like amidohydrolase
VEEQMRRGDFKIIKAARLIDGRGGPVVDRGAVLVEGDRIVAAGPEETVHPPEGAPCQELRYDNQTVLPGLIDCHVHLIGIGDGRMGDELTKLPDEVLTLQAARNARAHLYSGVTTVRDCGAKNRTTFMLRRAIEMGITPGPRLVLAGRPMAIVGGHLSYFGVGATGPTECRAAVRRLVEEGADFIKITATGGSTRTSFRFRPSFTVEEMKAIADEAHRFGKHTAAHATASQGITNALDAGIDTIIHGLHNEPDGTLQYRPEISARMAEKGVFLNPTLHQGRERMWQLMARARTGQIADAERSEIDAFRQQWDERLEFWGRVRADGVTLVAGSDASWGYYELGGSCFQDEISAHVDIGMAPMEAIVSATLDSARSCWADDRVGTLETGKMADLLVVDGDPSQDISALKDVADVFLGGEMVERHDRP